MEKLKDPKYTSLRSIILETDDIIMDKNTEIIIRKENDYLVAEAHPIMEEREEKHTEDNPLYDRETNSYIFTKVLEYSDYYSALYGNEYDAITFKLDKNNNFYINDEEFNISTYENTMIGDMYKILNKYKKKTKRRIKKLKR